MNSKWSVLAVYENEAARDLVVQFCDALVQRFWPEFSVELNWTDWSNLKNPGNAREARQKASEADLIIVATKPKGRLSDPVSWWLESALHNRADREGILVGLPLPETDSNTESSATQVYLRRLAHQSGMDYLASVPENLPHPEPESFDSYNVRATQVTTILDTILHHCPPPPRP